MTDLGTYRIKPAGRHILTIGRDLIQDHYAAIVELVKNAYDADSPDAHIIFKSNAAHDRIWISVADHGHGMSRTTVIDRWLVPSTDDKVFRKTSPSGRTMQGRKGVGRYAAAILGDDLLLETTTVDGESTSVFVEWAAFEKAKYLDDVEILVESRQSPAGVAQGTTLTIAGGPSHLAEWTDRQISRLKFELKKLTSPVNKVVPENDTRAFQIKLTFDCFYVDQLAPQTELIEPYPIVELFDYRIAGEITPDGKGQLTYYLHKARNAVGESIAIDLQAPTECGRLVFDIRVYDREKEAIEQLIGRGLKDDAGNYVGKLQARQLLDQYNGIGVYRNGFRLRPLGDPDFDWLRLNEQRVQNPSQRIGSNQVIGYVLIENEEASGLMEKSARDGLRDNRAYARLKEISLTVISKLEERRFSYRQKAGLSRPVLKIEAALERLFSFDEIKSNIRRKLQHAGVSKEATDGIIGLLDSEEAEKSKLVDDLRQAVATYQGQATLGKIINVVLHEGRRPLNYFKNQIPNMTFWSDELRKKYDQTTLTRILEIADGVGVNADILARLFSRLDPLAAGKRGAAKAIPLKRSLANVFAVFEGEMIKHKINYEINGPDNFVLAGWLQDIYSVFTNLIDNSVYWMVATNATKRLIAIEIAATKDALEHIDYRDTGPGIETHLIESGVIFEPEFTTKSGGTGLGLAIAGEAATRLGLELHALESQTGAHFRLLQKTVT